MTMIELTLTNAGAPKIYINAAHVSTVCRWNGKTELQMQGGREYTVAESVDQVLRMLPSDDDITLARINLENIHKLQYQHR
jgi:uncharacterized protein YlzI (FlbEa/FlbD family)